MTPPTPHNAATVPLALRAAVGLWLLTVPVCLALGLLGLTSVAAVAAQPLPPPAVIGAAQARALIALLGVLSVALEVGFAALPLRHALPLRRPGPTGRRARTSLTVLAAAGTTATAVGYLAVGNVPFTATPTFHNLAHDSLEVLWLLAALIATALSFTRPARRHLTDQP